MKCGAVTRLTLNPDFTPVLLNDAKDHRKPQAGAFTDLLGRKEWFEDSGTSGGIHSAAVIRNGEMNLVPTTECCPNCYATILSDCISGVYDQIHHYLLDLYRIGFYA